MKTFKPTSVAMDNALRNTGYYWGTKYKYYVVYRYNESVRYWEPRVMRMKGFKEEDLGLLVRYF